VEGVVIVGSILLAFGIQAWWDESQDRAEEQRVLAALLAEFEESGEVLQGALGEYRQRYLEAEELLDLMEAEAPGIDAATFDRLLLALLESQTFHLESGAHTALLGSGNMDLISDEVLRNRLAAWPSYVAEWSEEEDAVFALAGDVIAPYVAQHVRLRDVGRTFAPFLNGDAPQPIAGGSIDAASRALLSTSLEFENLVYRRAQSTWYALRDGETLQAQLSAVMSRIRLSLEE
jgi:hypothetical protein